MNVFAIVIKSSARVHWRIVVLKTFKRILRNPIKTSMNIFFLNLKSVINSLCRRVSKNNATYNEVEVEVEMMKIIRRTV